MSVHYRIDAEQLESIAELLESGRDFEREFFTQVASDYNQSKAAPSTLSRFTLVERETFPLYDGWIMWLIGLWQRLGDWLEQAEPQIMRALLLVIAFHIIFDRLTG